MNTENVVLENVNVGSFTSLVTPADLHRELPVSERAKQTIVDGREAIRNILDGKDSRLLVVVGPCSIHDPEQALDYARRLRTLADQVKDTLYIVMRVYFEKPRTTTGWKGLINDPFLNDTFEIEQGLFIARRLLIDIAEIGLPTATEALDPISPQYLQDLISWSAIGARTTESQTHRELASGLSCPVGFKNGTDGGLTVAINALKSASSPHRFLGIDANGQVAIVNTQGNAYAHVVLRGGEKGPNYHSEAIADAEQRLKAAGITPRIMIDCSHANSSKDHNRQPIVFNDAVQQILAGSKSIMGVMIESNLGAGNQKIPPNLQDLQYGVSITDACIDWSSTEQMLIAGHQQFKNR
ncbi:3-deoxy-7-phosphoheptulonate synthase [Thiofilum flexile]|uniref:3-deoxy-7-phosphoheptulonate synthase n=1 Tax=Thiofilum flexile TaxID=125627 RepID=UPI0003741C44|nr:3-deoxy-7-phosphoheptulonate synthase [Thiofilum flexile]